MESTVLFARSIEILCCCFVALAIVPSTADAQDGDGQIIGEQGRAGIVVEIVDAQGRDGIVLESIDDITAVQLPDGSRLEQAIRRNLDRMRAATVAVRVGSNEASGVVVEKDLVLTTGHAVSRIGETATATTNEGTRLSAKVHGIDRVNDVALLKLSKQANVRPVSLRARRRSEVAIDVLAIGHPSGFDSKRKAVIRFGQCLTDSVIQSTCRLAKGDSGGPLFDIESGEVIGIHKQIVKSSDGNYHASAKSILANWDRLKDGQTIEGRQPVLPKRKFEPRLTPKLKWLSPVAVVKCDGKQAALGTIIQSRNGAVIITKASELHGKVTVSLGSRVVETKIQRVNRRYDIAVLKPSESWNISESPKAKSTKAGTLVVSKLPGSSEHKTGIIGANRRPIEREAPAFGVTLDELRITTVAPNSAAKIAKLRVGDELKQFDETRLKSQSDLGSALAKLDAGDRFNLLISRDGKQQQFNIQLLHTANRRFSDDAFQQGAAGPLSLRRSGFPSVRQHDCDIQPNQCGGPLVDFEGRLLGVNIARAGREATYAIPIEIVRKITDLGN